MDTLFVSDLHLASERPSKIELFRRFFEGPARRARAVYILGDLFERFWTGNDECAPPAPEVIGILQECTRHNDQVYLLRGNRELMLDQGFCNLSGCRLLDDETVLDVAGRPTLIMHGDLLCSRDTSYQRYRKFMETPFIRRLFLGLPRPLRLFFTRGLQPLLKRASAQKPAGIIDVDQATVEAFMARHDTTELIHGHTHRPGVHHFTLHGQPARRIVLGDWYKEDTVLVCRDGERKLLRVQEYINQSSR